ATAISDEATTARNAELVLTNNLTTENSRAIAAEAVNATAISDEATTARNAELVLTNNLVSEAATARAAESNLNNDLLAEVSNRTNADLLKAPLASPTLTGTPTAPTASSGNNTTQIATTAFVTSTISSSSLDALSDAKIGGANFANSMLIGHQTTGVLDNAIRNTGVGFGSLNSLTTGDNNTANGYNSLSLNTTGNNNTTNGFSSLFNNTTGNYNTANGSTSLFRNTEGSNNTATGYNSLYNNTTGNLNTSNGFNSLFYNTTGDSNIANGYGSLSNNTEGSNNTANGAYSLLSNTTGINNVGVGFQSNVASGGLNNSTAIGANAIVDASNKVQIGDGNVTAVQLGTGTKVTLATGFIKLTGGTPAAGKVLTSDADGLASWQSAAVAASSISGTVAIANGGTGATTNTAAFNVLSPMTTAGDILYGGLSGAGTRLGAGTNGQVLTLTSGIPAWTTPSAADGSETKVKAGASISVTGSGTAASPYVVNATGATTLTIGQSYQGGKIFWLDATGQHGLIAATVDQSVGIQWYNGIFRFAGTSGDGLYAGAMNTAMIVATHMTDNQNSRIGNFAAIVCADYSVIDGSVTYGDWYLPSKYELNLLYNQKTVVGGFAGNMYWSTNEENGLGYAWFQDFTNGWTAYTIKSDKLFVRAVRAF
ncbi:MAG: hypothetical protein H7320_01410, partial [Ferruginibacter sp.]|nr:hypothetical protein [Ferruginibacter sp.]